jgi:hypothetical protein
MAQPRPDRPPPRGHPPWTGRSSMSTAASPRCGTAVRISTKNHSDCLGSSPTATSASATWSTQAPK